MFTARLGWRAINILRFTITQACLLQISRASLVPNQWQTNASDTQNGGSFGLHFKLLLAQQNWFNPSPTECSKFTPREGSWWGKIKPMWTTAFPGLSEGTENNSPTGFTACCWSYGEQLHDLTCLRTSNVTISMNSKMYLNVNARLMLSKITHHQGCKVGHVIAFANNSVVNNATEGTPSSRPTTYRKIRTTFIQLSYKHSHNVIKTLGSRLLTIALPNPDSRFWSNKVSRNTNPQT